MDEQISPKKSKIWPWVVIIVLVVIAGGIYVGWRFCGQKNKNSSMTSSDSTKNAVSTSENAANAKWQEGGVAISGQFADADIVDLGGGRYRLYYSAEPETPGFQGQVYSATSSDGIAWTKEDGTRKTWATFPDVIKLSDNSWRMYFQNAGVIKSATSTDGLTWTDEPGTRIDAQETGHALVNVGAQSTTKLDDGTFIMVYRGTINTPYQASEPVPNKDTQVYFWATSTDGLTFVKKGLAVDSRSETLYGLADGAEWVKWDNSELRLFFWSYTGVYHTIYKDGSFSAPVFDWTNNKNSRVKFSENPPCDPTLIKINSQWFMYYGQHTKGIYYAIYK